MTTMPDRKDIAKEHTWDTESVFASDADFDAALKAAGERLSEVQAFQGRLGEGPDTLADCIELIDEISLAVGKLRTYATLRFSVDTGDQTAAGINDRTGALMAQAGAAISFMEPELLAVGADTLLGWAEDNDRLRVYRHYFDTLAKKAVHVRSAEVEQLLSLVTDPFRTAAGVHGVISDADMTFPDAVDSEGKAHTISQGTIDALLASPDKELRHSAGKNYAQAYLQLKNGLGNALSAGFKQQVFMARARRYNSALEAALHQTHIPAEVFRNLIETYRKHLPTWHRYWQVRKRALGYDTLHLFDTRAVLTDKEPHVPYEQAVDWIAAGMAPLGEEYVDVMRKGCLEERWVDIYPNKGKRAGAFSSGAPGTHPFILMSYTDDLGSMSTLAHELGHSMHSYYSRKHQPRMYAWYGIFAAEVASNFNQALVRHHLFAENDDLNFQIALIEEAMGNFHRYFFIMPTLARFELEMHERIEQGQPVTADIMIDRLAELFGEGYGDEVEYDKDELGITWAQFPTHLYMNFYVYQYATGISGAHALAQRILDGEEGAVDAYLGFLKAGGSDYPLEILKRAGVDLTSPEPVEQTFAVLAGLVDRLEALVDAR